MHHNNTLLFASDHVSPPPFPVYQQDANNTPICQTSSFEIYRHPSESFEQQPIEINSPLIEIYRHPSESFEQQPIEVNSPLIEIYRRPSETFDVGQIIDLDNNDNDETQIDGYFTIKREYQPKFVKRKRKHGFLKRQRTPAGRRILKRRIKKGRWRVSV
eukprot:CAMPEP_0201552204 /NCGR_PEP_ID=MMETSP0173_2-20130828/14555_1 /ASSEMBLY_ACC=CAM_ASM_000268 /TAXON_ID=218659 /ORGANISM="Vexillifera sp., Strain DIVA3 564/2" /LENGTH=158 /DNA_ID=CAMNT_0047962645 /DNA_START=74 /DNA_END=550 /DNA_ORIENTATION=+